MGSGKECRAGMGWRVGEEWIVGRIINVPAISDSCIFKILMPSHSGV